ncbi:MAG: F0F1 ATP synthase subunit B [Planctomycetia bacterium]|nr:F0F1 ATP synthase subunit B [Planctomycetia bacterium]
MRLIPLNALALLVVLAFASPVLAAEAGQEGGKLDFLGLQRYDLGIYTLIVFGLLIFVLNKYAWPKIKVGLERREASIKGALEEAKRERQEAKNVLEQARKQLNETALQVKAMLDEARRDADNLRTEQREIGVKEAQAERARAKREIETRMAGLSKDVYEQAVTLAALMAEKALRRQVSISDHQRLLDESLAELQSAANKA